MSSFEMLLVAGMFLVTFGVRYPVLALVSRVTLPPAVLGALKFIPPAVLTAIIVPAVLQPQGQRLGNHRLGFACSRQSLGCAGLQLGCTSGGLALF